MPLLLLSNLNPPTAGLQVGFLNISRRDEKGAGVNDVPVARQSRDLARPQAGSPVRVTKNRQASEGACRFLLLHYSLFTNLWVDFWKVISKK